MKFLCLVHFAPDAFSGFGPEEQRRLNDATIEHDHKLRQSGHLIFAGPLGNPADAVTIDHRRRLKVDTVDGPFTESKEVVGGFLLVEAPSIDAAAALFADDPITAHGRIEIRPVIETHRHSATGAERPGLAT